LILAIRPRSDGFPTRRGDASSYDVIGLWTREHPTKLVVLDLSLVLGYDTTLFVYTRAHTTPRNVVGCHFTSFYK